VGIKTKALRLGFSKVFASENLLEISVPIFTKTFSKKATSKITLHNYSQNPAIKDALQSRYNNKLILNRVEIFNVQLEEAGAWRNPLLFHRKHNESYVPHSQLFFSPSGRK
jgi:hypothetical protein